MNRAILLAPVVGLGLMLAPRHASADLPVIDAAALVQLGKSVVTEGQELVQLIETVKAVTDVIDFIEVAPQLVEQQFTNPINGIQNNIQAIMHGGSLGTCTAAAGMYGANTYFAPTGDDFMAQNIVQRAHALAGLQGCFLQLLQTATDRLQALPQLLGAAQESHDVTGISGWIARIQQETGVVHTQNLQGQQLLGLLEAQQYAFDQRIVQKQRADAEQAAADYGAGAAAAPPIAGDAIAVNVPVFNAGG